MTTDFQQARIALGVRLRELRAEGGHTGREFAERMGWPQSKVSKLESGKQTATVADLTAWAEAAGNPSAATELKARLLGAETAYRSWRRQLAGGHRARQDAAIEESQRTSVIRAFESSRIPGLLQTSAYARALLTMAADFADSPRDVEEAVRARMKRQESLYEAGRRFRFVLWEAALYAQVGPPAVMIPQLDRLTGLVGMDSVEIGIIPLATRLKRTPAHGFWIYDERLVIVETINAEMWLDDAADVALYARAWEWLNETAVFDHLAQHLLARARAALEGQ
ncbi:helix-turn-helix protein [Streptomyces sp. 846.5]|nr:helix-turn-helix transcriptional regulator [Streptomyces sp. 846.5]TDT95327.1 helix-turn-helix protein [Streptomyces sp. 846.5]